MKNKEFFMPLALGACLTVLAAGALFFLNRLCAAISLALGGALLLLFWLYTRKRYRRLGELNNYLSLVCAGNYELEIADNTEGELSVLKNNLYKVIALLKSSNEALARDKVYLADALADISHQLKTPLTSMTVMTDLLKEEPQPQKRAEFINTIDAQLTKMNWLIQTLLTLSKIDAGTVPFVSEPFAVSELIACSVRPFLIPLELKNISLRLPDAAFTLTGDKNWTVEALQNIIKNCMEHTPAGGEIQITAATTAILSEIVIADNGSGIDPAELPHIFDRFYKGKNSASDSVGIGLALAKSILQRQNASVTAESAPGQGTKFVIRFYKSIL